MLRRPASRRRECSGKILVMLALLMPVMVGMLGLVLDTGLLIAAQRETQNAADAAAMAAAMDIVKGNSTATATTTATTFVQTYNGLSSATVVINRPPTSGPYKGLNNYVEAIVSYPVQTMFMQVVVGNSPSSVTARAVAGYEAVSAGEGVAVLDPNPPGNTGLSITGSNTVLAVNGRVIDNATDSTAALAVSSGTVLKANIVDVVGGASGNTNVQPYTSGSTAQVLYTNQLASPDPLINLPTPTTSNGVNSGSFSVTVNNTTSTVTPGYSIIVNNNDTVTLNPGIYSGITIKGGTVTFNPGIYVLKQPSNGGGTNILAISGGTVTGNGVMFYNTGSDYDPVAGTPDSSDGSSSPDPPKGTQFGAIQINSATVNLQPISDGTFAGMLFYQRRWNTQTVKITASSGNLSLGGTLYDKWGKFDLSGGGSYQAQFIVGSMSVSGGATVTVNYAGTRLGKANQVYLVE
jgi:Flp pilus assembly protein TadG